MWFEVYKHFDKDCRALSYSKTHSFLIRLVRWCPNRQGVKDNCLLMQQEAQTSGEGRWRRGKSAWGGFSRKRSITPVKRRLSSYPFLFDLCASNLVGLCTAVPFSLNGKTAPSSASLIKDTSAYASISMDAKRNLPYATAPTVSVPCVPTLIPWSIKCSCH